MYSRSWRTAFIKKKIKNRSSTGVSLTELTLVKLPYCHCENFIMEIMTIPGLTYHHS